MRLLDPSIYLGNIETGKSKKKLWSPPRQTTPAGARVKGDHREPRQRA